MVALHMTHILHNTHEVRRKILSDSAEGTVVFLGRVLSESFLDYYIAVFFRCPDLIGRLSYSA